MNAPTEKELFRKKKQAQLNEWKADLAKLKAKASGASADAQLKLHQRLEALEGKIDEGKEKLDELAETSEEMWDALQDRIETTWEVLKTSLREATGKPKDD